MISSEKASEIANEHYKDIYYCCLNRLRNDIEAEDVTQEVFLLFQQKCESLDDKNIKSWLYSTADKIIKTQFRKIARHEKELIWGEDSTIDEAVCEIEYDSLIDDSEIQGLKDKIISTLSEKELELFEMVYIKHMKYEDICKELDISNGNLRVRISRLSANIKAKISYAFMAILLLLMRI